MAKRLKDAGVPEAHAEVLADTLREREEAGLANLVTKTEFAEAVRDLKAELGDLKRELNSDIRELVHRIDTKISDAKFDLIQWVAPVIIAQFLALIGLYFE